MSAVSNEDDPGGAAPTIVDASESPLTHGRIVWYSLANLGCGAFYAFNLYVLPLYLHRFTSNAVLLGLMGSSHSIEGAVIQPLVGNASDRLQSRWGRRRPFILVFFVLSALVVLATPLAARLPDGTRLAGIVGCIFLFTVLFNIGWDPYQALMPDITPPPQRGQVTGVWALFGNVAQAGILVLPLLLGGLFRIGFSFSGQFALVGVLMVVTTALTCVGIQERIAADRVSAPKHPFAEIGTALRGLRTLKQGGVVMLESAIFGAGIGVVAPNISLFVKTVTRCGDGEAQMMGFVLLIATGVFVIPFGALADRIGARKVIFVSLSVLTAACASALFVHTLAQVAVVMVVAGIGNAAQAASAYPLLTEVVPASEVGFYTGFQSTMLSIAQPVTVTLTGLLINHALHGGRGDAGSSDAYRLIFLVSAGCMLAAIAVLTQVHLQAAPEEIRRRELELGREV